MTATTSPAGRELARHAAPRQVAPPASGFRADIQGLRAIAVAAVVLYHAGTRGFGGGYVGVDVFFVISGFLITGHLCTEYGRRRSISIGQFYARRVMRLLPASFLVLIVTLVMCRLLLPPTEFPSVAADAKATAVYLLNMHLAQTNTSYLGNAAPSPFQHYWSLGVEEQFYLILPLLLLFGLRLTRGRSTRLIPPAALLCAVSFAGCVYLTAHQQPLGFFWLVSRAWEFGVGGIVALAAPPLARLARPIAILLTWTGLAAILACCTLYSAATVFPGTAAALPVLGTALVIAGGTAAGRGGATSVLGLAPLQLLGGISYSLYLWHWPLLVVPATDRDHGLSVPARVLLVALSVVLALATARLVERRFRSLPALKRSPVRVWGVLVVLTLVSVSGGFALGRLPVLHTDQVLQVWPAAPLAPPAPTTVGRNVTPSLLAAAADLPSINANGCMADFEVVTVKVCTAGAPAASANVVLFGDSHAEQWFPAVDAAAKAAGLTLNVVLKASCPPMPVDVINPKLGRDFTECTQWRRRALAVIAALKPATIVIGQFQAYQLVHDGDPSSAWATGLSNLLLELPRSSKVIVLGDSPHWAYSPLACLAHNLSSADNCTKPLAAVVRTAQTAAEQRVAQRHGARFLDTSSWTCPAARCPAIMWNVPVYRDYNHVTASFAGHFSAPIAAALKS